MQVERVPSGTSGERVSNTWVTYPEVGDNPRKLGLIPHMATAKSLRAPLERPAADYLILVGEVTAHQGYDR